jgi:hypothetical protein
MSKKDKLQKDPPSKTKQKSASGVSLYPESINSVMANMFESAAKTLDTYPSTLQLAQALTKFDQYKDSSAGDFISLLEQISKTESGNKNIRQHNNGPGRGYFQVEPPTAQTAKNRAINIIKELKPLGDTLTLPKFNNDFTKLSKDEQAFYTLSNLVKNATRKRQTNPDYKIDFNNPGKAWFDLHWAGEQSHPQDVKARQKHWNTTHPKIPIKLEDGGPTGGWLDQYEEGGEVGEWLDKFKHGGLVHDEEPPTESNVSTKVTRAALWPFTPTNVRQLTAGFVNNDNKYSINDMPEAEQIALFNSLENARKEFGNKGGTEYRHYGKNYHKALQGLEGDPLGIIAASMFSSDFNAATTAGRVSYTYDPKTDTYNVTDGSYNFHETPKLDSSYSLFRNAVGKAAKGTNLESNPKVKETPHNLGSFKRSEWIGKKQNPGILDFSYDNISKVTQPISTKIQDIYYGAKKGAAQMYNEGEQMYQQAKKIAGFKYGGQVKNNNWLDSL